MSVFSFRRLLDYNKDDYNTSSQVRRVDCCNADQMTDALPPKDFGSMVIAAGSFYVNRYCQLRLYDSLYNKYLEYDRWSSTSRHFTLTVKNVWCYIRILEATKAAFKTLSS